MQAGPGALGSRGRISGRLNLSKGAARAQALGVAADLGPEGVAVCLREVGLGFMFASRFNPAMAAVNPTRKALRVRTAFNLLGPLLNPARTPFSLARTRDLHPCPSTLRCACSQARLCGSL